MADLKDDPNTLVGWLKKNYPSEFDLQQEIGRRVDAIYRKVPFKIQENVHEQIFIGVRKNPDAEQRGNLIMTDWGVVFLGAMSRAILESLSGQLQGLLESDAGDVLIKKKINEVFASMVKFSTTQQAPDGQLWLECHNCHKQTPANGKFCMNCGTTIK